ncbi:MAG TPA: MBL fold metallo-hydrolase [Pyrinomonadaceae bacterium]|nr:MBL fold metallo-hydrolase [Pyrinomonadaceae bacterium]
MTSPKYYLKQNVQAEPLLNQWYAWSHLIAPASAAMNIANLHLKIMRSYINGPQIHANAVKNPAMLGGPFIDYQGGRVDEIKALMEKTMKEQAHMIAFAESVKTLDDMLRSEAKGLSLEPVYEKIPQNLRGFVELVYDLNNNPSIKFIEGLLYKSPYYNLSSQSLSLSLINQDDRAFVLSTPRLPDDKALHVKIPFNDEGVDELFKMKHEPQPYEYIAERLGLEAKDRELFSTFLTQEEPPTRQRYSGEGLRVRYYGHACILLETKDVSLLIDPVISYSYDNGIKRYTFSDLPDTIDYVLITHAHQDHIMFETLFQIRHMVKTFIVPRSRGGCLEDPSIKMILQNIGFKNVVEIDDMETIDIPGGTITGLPFLGEHGDCNIGSKIAHLIKLKGKTILFAADSNNIEPMLYKHLAEYLGDIDVLYIGMECDGAPMSWLYGPLMTRPLDRKMDQSRRFTGSNCERGTGIIEQFNCKEVYIYAMGQEPWLTYVMSIKYTDESNPIVASNRLVEDCTRRGIIAERLFGQKESFYGV